ncbi:NADH:flavin oxidoreductase [Polyangium aurulentum]|uniref:oxidoreductase n=1 Tax=Polyangium aurulentum TaxID=2567896 RepID=UPI003B834B01
MMTNRSTAAALHPALSSTSIGALRLSNRLVVAPMSRVSTAGDGVPTEAMRRYYAAFAEGGFGLVITEGTYPDLAHSQGYADQPGLATDAQAAAWRPIVDAVHAAGAKIIVQLMHAGALSQGNRHRGETIGPSAVQPKGEKLPEYGGSGPYATPRAMNEDDIRDVLDGFARAAVRARDVGFDGVELHAANGYLFDQFLTTYTNTRTDPYGGPVENRIRFAADAVRAMRGVVGSGLLIGTRVSQAKVNDFTYRWPGGAEDGKVIFAALRDAGADYLHVAGEGRGWRQGAQLPGGVSLTEIARHVGELPVIANGGLDDPALSARVIEGGHADLVSIGRGALANPDWPRRLAEGAPFEPFDRAMLHPYASIENVEQWRRSRAALG